MIISDNPAPHLAQFNTLLHAAVTELNTVAQKNNQVLSHMSGSRLEPYVKDVMVALASGTVFEGSIELISGQKFPDIIAAGYYGVEVKSTTQNHWKTTGNSVLESTRVDGIEKIFMLFGKLHNPIEFRYRPYQDCLSEVVVTHSPRYLVDMNLPDGATIFNKLNIPYDELRTKPNPVKPIIDYYRTLLKPGEDLWWMDQGNEQQTNSPLIKIWNNLTTAEKRTIIAKALMLFPNLLSNRNDKFGPMAIWLIKQEGIVCPNIRDMFTAGGKVDITIGNETYRRLPKIIKTLIDNLPTIYTMIDQCSAEEISKAWHTKPKENNKRSTWIECVSEIVQQSPATRHFDIAHILYSFAS